MGTVLKAHQEMSVIWVDLKSVKPNVWNPNRQDKFMFSRTMASIKKFGFVDPITARETADGFEIIDGEHRFNAARRLGLKTIPIINFGLVPDHIAQQMTLAFQIHGENEPERLANVLAELDKQIGREELQSVIPFTPNEVKHILDGITKQNPEPPKAAEEWVEITCLFPKEAEPVIRDEFKRIAGLLELNPSLPETVRNGLILEQICVLSGDTPTESLE